MNRDKWQIGAYVCTVVTLPVMAVVVLFATLSIREELLKIVDVIRPVTSALGEKGVEAVNKLDTDEIKDQAEDVIETGFDSLKERMQNWANRNKE